LQKEDLGGYYFNLGIALQDQQHLDESEEWIKKALHVWKGLRNRRHMAAAYQELGMVAKEQGRLNEAEKLYDRSLALRRKLGDRPGVALVYHELGTLALERRELEKAQDWYLQGLAIRRELGDRPGTALAFHQLGIVAYIRGQLEDAEEWLHSALSIRETLGNRLDLARTYAQLSRVRLQWGNGQEDLEEALEWIVRCVAQFDDFPHPAVDPSDDLVRLTAALGGIGVLSRTWLEVTGQPLPLEIQRFVQARLLFEDPDDPGFRWSRIRRSR
jgi:tetratricopeptide (TPR) repeat protein